MLVENEPNQITKNLRLKAHIGLIFRRLDFAKDNGTTSNESKISKLYSDYVTRRTQSGRYILLYIFCYIDNSCSYASMVVVESRLGISQLFRLTKRGELARVEVVADV